MAVILTTPLCKTGRMEVTPDAMFRHWWNSWWTGRAPRLGHLQFILYTRRGCHLCEDAWEYLQDRQRRYGFHLTCVDIDTDPVLQASYRLQVPVVTVNGKVRFRGHVNPVLLKRLLETNRGARP